MEININGMIVAGVCFLVIGLFHPIVVKTEYYFSSRVWPVFLVLGLLFLAFSTQTGNMILSSILGVIGCACLWSILELKEQEKRVSRGWFSENPRRKRRR